MFHAEKLLCNQDLLFWVFKPVPIAVVTEMMQEMEITTGWQNGRQGGFDRRDTSNGWTSAG